MLGGLGKALSNHSSEKSHDHTKRSKIKGLVKNLALSLAGLLLFVFLMEIVLRWFGFGNLVIYQPDRKLFWKPKLNQSCYTKFGHKPVHINSKGTRGKEFSETKPDNVFRIISLGDSRTFGWGLSEPETYSGLLENHFQEQAGDSLGIEVINAGVNAWSYAQMYVYLRDIGMKYNPDMVILARANRWTQFSEESSQEFVDTFMRRVELKNLLRRSAIYHYVIEIKLRKAYHKYRTLFIPIDYKQDGLFKDQQKVDPEQFQREQIVNICDLLNDNNIKGLLIYIPAKGERPSSRSKIRQIKEEVGKSFNIPLVDFTEDFANRQQELFLPGDHSHPNAEGNRIIADRLLNIIVEELY